MLELIFMACSLLNGNACKSVSLFLHPTETLVGRVDQPIYAEASPVTPVACAKNGQAEMAKWVNEHPNWTTGRGFTCRPAGVMAKA